MVECFKKIKDGLLLGIGFMLVILLVFAGYAFVEPDAGPSVNNYMTQYTSAQASITANNGMYDNRIPRGSFPTAYTEICFKNGTTKYDIHDANQDTGGGNCLPGDVGFVMERNERSATSWEQAKKQCLEIGMRLPEPFEFKVACVDASNFGLNGMTGNWEWASNFALPMYTSNSGVGAAVVGYGSCSYVSWDWVGKDDGSQPSHAFRCVK